MHQAAAGPRRTVEPHAADLDQNHHKNLKGEGKPVDNASQTLNGFLA